MALSFDAGCGQAPDGGQALEEQQQENEELQKELEAQQEELEAQKQEQEEAEEQAEAAEREEMQQEIEELKKQVEEGSEPRETGQPESGSDSPDVVIESNDDWTAPPSQAPEGVVVVSSDYDVGAVTTEEAEVLNSAIAYYQAAELGDYYETHSLLSVDDQNLYPLDSWVEANTSLDSAAGEFVVTGAYPEDLGNGYPAYAVNVTVYLPDGTSFDRTTYFTNEGNGYWAHWLSEEEMEMFNGAV